MGRGCGWRRRTARPGVGRGALGAVCLVSVCLGALALLAPAATAAGGSSGTTRSAASPKLTQLGHVTFWECKSKTTEMLVAVNSLSLHPGQPLVVTFTVRNQAATSCNYTAPYAGAAAGATASSLQAGPCGSVGLEILGPHDRDVWPGVQVVHCPALGFAQLAPNGTVSGTGTWDQTVPNSAARVAAGSYTLVVNDRHFSFPLHVLAH
jgi:hypothetical protein